MYYSTQDTLTPAKVGAYSLALNVALNFVLLFGFGRYLMERQPGVGQLAGGIF